MNKAWIAALGVLIVVATGVGLIHGGMVDFAADTPHSRFVFNVIDWAKVRSVERGSAEITVPDDLSDTERIRRGAGNYDTMCAGCHLTPAVRDSEIRKGLYPQPPDLARPEQVDDDPGPLDARRFWIIKHGIKGSGMPAWARGGMSDSDIWDLVAFLRMMPTLSPDQYRRQVEASGGHSHAGMHNQTSGVDHEEGEHHPHGAKPHSHKNGDHH